MTNRAKAKGDRAELEVQRLNLFWAEDGWLVDLREYRSYPVYGEWDWIARTDNLRLGFRG